MSTKKKQKQKRRKRLHLYLLNDEVNSFEYVVKVLMSMCGHNAYQAEQCATITHNNGKSHIYSGLGMEPILVYESLIKHGLSIKLTNKKL